MKRDEERSYDEDYFDQGECRLGAYEYYRFEKVYPFFCNVATLIEKHFDPKRVLDLGCAKGFLVYAFREMGIEAFGVDLSEYALLQAPAKVRRFLYKVHLEKDSLPFEDDVFDFVTILGTIEYLQDHSNVVNEVKRVLRLNGTMLLTTVYKRRKNDAFRIGAHSKAYWRNEFAKSWKAPGISPLFMSDFLKGWVLYLPCTHYKFRLGKLLLERLELPDKMNVLMYELATAFRMLDLGIILLTLKKKDR